MAEQTATTLIGILNVAIPVNDHDRAVRFYTETLGFEIRRDAAFGPGMRWVEVAPPGVATTVALAPPGGRTVGVDTGIRLSTQDAERTHQQLREQGVDVDADILRVPGVPPMFSFRDVDGNTLFAVETQSA